MRAPVFTHAFFAAAAATRFALDRRNQHLLIILAVVVSSALIIQHRFSIGINVTQSLPDHVYLIVKGADVHRGELMAFRWSGGLGYGRGVTFVKIALGAAGDRVTRIGRTYAINGFDAGTAKSASRTGVPLEPGDVGTLGANQFYAYAPHPDSLDSRYRAVGWITRDRIVGRAYALF